MYRYLTNDFVVHGYTSIYLRVCVLIIFVNSYGRHEGLLESTGLVDIEICQPETRF
jgi:hypothetical protein